MTTVAMVVEGHGEVAALPILLRRLNEWRNPDVYVNLSHPIRVRRDRFLNRNEEFRRILLLAAAKCGENGWILVLLDADDDCPAEIGRQILERARTCIPHRRVSVVVANKEFEAWFIAAAKSLHGRRGFRFDPDEEGVEAEQPQDAKGWMSMRMASGKYRETTDQPAFSARMDLEQAYENSRSFRKLCREWTNQLTSE
ncbi:MAG: DUF4276 family protein [Candidatus Thiodiazotropha sp. (ex Dulcina madagascariensis)]|nr:DUF4276 family protein [Candidatus Thiodiazotropha sp. (ex Dulcina madagascariensis)]